MCGKLYPNANHAVAESGNSISDAQSVFGGASGVGWGGARVRRSFLFKTKQPGVALLLPPLLC